MIHAGNEIKRLDLESGHSKWVSLNIGMCTLPPKMGGIPVVSPRTNSKMGTSKTQPHLQLGGRSGWSQAGRWSVHGHWACRSWAKMTCKHPPKLTQVDSSKNEWLEGPMLRCHEVPHASLLLKSEVPPPNGLTFNVEHQA